jgi:hypothetical protein
MVFGRCDGVHFTIGDPYLGRLFAPRRTDREARYGECHDNGACETQQSIASRLE